MRSGSIAGGSPLALLFFSGLTVALRVSAEQKKPESEAVKQPISFSHKQHIKIGLECSSCHPMAGSGEEAGIPTVADCMDCHQTIKIDSVAVKTLTSYYKDRKEIVWIRVYRLPGFVFFSHKNHVTAKVDCEDCHGPVRLAEVVSKKRDMSMNFCVGCHRTRKISFSCNTCHQLPK
jgi:hypothetical protein